MTLFSKFQTIDVSCVDYVHPWTNSCAEATAGLLLHSMTASFRIYLTAYLLTLVMRNKIPTKKDISYTIAGILQSTSFLTCQAFGFSLVLCTMRRVLGHFNFFTISFLPSFITNVASILVERPSRRGLLSLYVTNVATETLFRMAVDRKWVKPIQYGEVIIFSLSSAFLLYFYRGAHDEKDSIYSLLRFFVGPYEEGGYKKKEVKKDVESSENHFNQFSNYIKSLKSHRLCQHPHSCLYYSLQSGAKLFSIGCALQVCLKLLLQMNRLMSKPQLVFKSIFESNTLRLGAFFAGFGGLFRAVSCLLRHARDQDSDLNAVPSGLIAGLAFFFFSDNTAALYGMWKAIMILYNCGVERGSLPPLPGATVFFYSLATAILFHAAVFEPHNIRPSYWRFLTNVSGNRINTMNRECLEVFGLESSKSLKIAQERLLKKK